MSMDVDRRAKLALANSGRAMAYLEEYWPADPSRRKPFQPEPGCSSPTFRGSWADVLNLASRMINVAATWLAENTSAPRAFGMDLSRGGSATRSVPEIAFQWLPHRVMTDGHHVYQVRMSEEALAAVLAWTRRSERVRGRRVETGGVLFGEVDELLKVVWIDEVSGPPPDSAASPEGFLCGTAGVAGLHAEKVERTRGSVSFVGMWHTHPQALPIPSETDLGAMRELLGEDATFLGRRFLMMIVGGTSKTPILSTTVFRRSDYVE
jgi:integrative and conjugative element protein (TIGR02256 family)